MHSFKKNFIGYNLLMLKNYAGAQPEKVLKEVFGHDSFRLLQKNIIESVLSRRDTLAVMPTGGGKSICFQIPALVFKGITVVISPLISLMQDQVDSLSESGIAAVFLNSTVDRELFSEYARSIRSGETKIVYVSPEGLTTGRIRDLLCDSGVNVSCFTIDEAHCVSEWGHDFRPDYLELASARRLFPAAVCLALTATATKEVRADIIKNLALKNPAVFVAGFNRANIYLEVRPKRNAVAQVIECVNRHKGESGIIYCFSRKQADNLAYELLRNGFLAQNYHAGLSDKERADHQKQFIQNQVQIIVATLAFGMGIDKSDVRFVIHYDLPKSLEQYYQEIGRAGRDGLPSEALLLFSAGDAKKIRYFFEESEDKVKAERLLRSMMNYATERVCRRRNLLAYFGEDYKAMTAEDSKPMDSGETNTDSENAAVSIAAYCCDLCREKSVNAREPKQNRVSDMTIQAQKLMSCVIRTQSRFGAAYVIDVLLGSVQKRVIENGHDKLSTWGIGKELQKAQWFRLVDLLIENGDIIKTEDFSVLKLTEKGLSALKNRDKFMLPCDFAVNDADNSVGAIKFPKPVRLKPSRSSFVSLSTAKSRFMKAQSQRSDETSELSSETERGEIDNIGTEEDEETQNLILELKKWRKKTSAQAKLPPYMIFSDKTLAMLAKVKPDTIEELTCVYGIGKTKSARYGEELISIIKNR